MALTPAQIEHIANLKSAYTNGQQKTVHERQRERQSDSDAKAEFWRVRRASDRIALEMDSPTPSAPPPRRGTPVQLADVPAYLAALGVDCTEADHPDDPAGWWLWFRSGQPQGETYPEMHQRLSERLSAASGAFGLSMWLKMATPHSAAQFERLTVLLARTQATRNAEAFKICLDAAYRGIAAIGAEVLVRNRVGDNAALLEAFEDQNYESLVD